jgi:predicted Fe-S protein YdhL (DUF1289 family)
VKGICLGLGGGITAMFAWREYSKQQKVSVIMAVLREEI